MSSSKTSTFVAEYSEEEIKKAHEVLYNEGLRMRIKVAGKDYVEKSLRANKDDFNRPMQEVHSPHQLPPPCTRSNCFVVRSRSLLGVGLGTTRAGSQSPLVPKHRNALQSEPLDRAGHARAWGHEQRCHRGRDKRGDLAGYSVLWHAGWY